LMATLTASAQGPVYSVNVVGFQKADVVDQDFAILANPFTQDTNDVNAVVGDQLTGFAIAPLAAKMFLWDTDANSGAGGYIQLFKNAAGQWVYVTDSGTLATNPIPSQVGFWVQNSTLASGTNKVVFVGDVVDDDSVTVPVNAGFQILSYPYSATKDVQTSGLTNGYAFPIAPLADRIFHWDAQQQSYKQYFLSSDRQWHYVTNAAVVATLNLEPNQGFWYQHVGSGFDWTEPRPYTLP